MDISAWMQRIQAIDLAALHMINHYRIRGLDPFFIAITDTAGIIAALIPTTILLVGLWLRNQHLKRRAGQLFLSFAIAVIISTILKYTINRPRPFIGYPFIEKLSTGGSPSFPSGHTTDAMVIAISLTLLMKDKALYLLVVWLWAIAVAYSRMVLGVHYPIDILGSIAVSLFGAFAGQWIIGWKNIK